MLHACEIVRGIDRDRHYMHVGGMYRDQILKANCKIEITLMDII